MKPRAVVALVALALLGTAAAAEGQRVLLQTTGQVAFLRVHDVGTGWGPANDHIDVEVVIRFRNRPNEAFGFQLRNDANRAARQGMLDLLRDAFENDWSVTIDYEIERGKRNGVIMRVALTK